MCFDPSELSIYDFEDQFLSVIAYAENPKFNNNMKQVWDGRRDFYRRELLDRYDEMDTAELEDWITDLKAEVVGDPARIPLLEAAEEALKAKAENGNM